MQEFLFDIGGFAVKAIITAGAALSVVFGGAIAFRRQRGPDPVAKLEVIRLDEVYQGMGDLVREATLDDKARKAAAKERKKRPSNATDAPRTFVIDFKGDVGAQAVDDLRRSISAVLAGADDADRVVVRLESPGGVVPGYGLGASQLSRIRQRGLHLTVCVDKVAASGGYMMAAVADEIVAAPFAVIGSIGVLLPVPNVHRWLRDKGIDYEEMTAGQFKRTISVAGEITEEGREKTKEQLEATHELFKSHVATHRPGIDIDAVATGEFWYGTQAKELGLIDRVETSDDVLAGVSDGHLLLIRTTSQKPLGRRLMDGLGQLRSWLP